LLVVVVHVACVLAWWTVERVPPLARGAGALAPLTVWLPQLAAPATAPAKETPPPQFRPSGHPRPDSAPAVGLADAASGQAPTAPDTPGAAQDSAAPTAGALNLNLPRGALTGTVPPGPAALSPFHGRLPATVEQIIANAAAESGPWTQERIDDDHIRLRRGNTCVLLERPLAAALDPFSDAARRMPWRANVLKC